MRLVTQIGLAYVAMVALVAVALDQGSLPEELGMSYEALFFYFFAVITGSVALILYARVVGRRVSERLRQRE